MSNSYKVGETFLMNFGMINASPKLYEKDLIHGIYYIQTYGNEFIMLSYKLLYWEASWSFWFNSVFVEMGVNRNGKLSYNRCNKNILY